MKYLYTFLLCFLCAVGTGYGLQIEATPTSLVIGLTTTLEVTCHTFINSSSQMESLMSLIITRSGHGPVKELASINVFSPDSHVVDVSNETLTGSGKIDNRGESYLRLVWRFPDVNKRGVYSCEAHGMSHTGHPVALTSTISVNSSIPAMSEVLNEFKNMALKLDLIKPYLFSISSPFHGHRYLLSNRHYSYEIKSAEAACELFGGYLVEIDSYEEHQFLINFLNIEKQKIRIFDSMIGLTDEQQENVWVNIHSQTVANYTQWLSSNPNGGRSHNCVVLTPPTWLMNDDVCSYTYSDFSLSLTYLCEVPDYPTI